MDKTTRLALIVREMVFLVGYFERFSDPLFDAERDVARGVLALIRGGATDAVTRRRVQSLVDEIGEHADGTEWQGLKHVVRRWLELTTRP